MGLGAGQHPQSSCPPSPWTPPTSPIPPPSSLHPHFHFCPPNHISCPQPCLVPPETIRADRTLKPPLTLTPPALGAASPGHPQMMGQGHGGSSGVFSSPFAQMLLQGWRSQHRWHPPTDPEPQPGAAAPAPRSRWRFHSLWSAQRWTGLLSHPADHCPALSEQPSFPVGPALDYSPSYRVKYSVFSPLFQCILRKKDKTSSTAPNKLVQEIAGIYFRVQRHLEPPKELPFFRLLWHRGTLPGFFPLLVSSCPGLQLYPLTGKVRETATDT